MKGNDLGNQVVPHDVLVWEGLLGLLPDTKVAQLEAKFRAKGKFDRAVALYSVNEMLARKIWDLVWRTSMKIDLVTYLGTEFALELEKRMDRESMPFSRVFSTDPNVFARNLIYQPDIRTVYDPFQEHQFLYGGKGAILLPDQYHLFGAL